jgi:hypothetical protein
VSSHHTRCAYTTVLCCCCFDSLANGAVVSLSEVVSQVPPPLSARALWQALSTPVPRYRISVRNMGCVWCAAIGFVRMLGVACDELVMFGGA